MRRCYGDRLAICMIGAPPVLENLDDMRKVDGVDAVVPSPSDLSQNPGHSPAPGRGPGFGFVTIRPVGPVATLFGAASAPVPGSLRRSAGDRDHTARFGRVGPGANAGGLRLCGTALAVVGGAIRVFGAFRQFFSKNPLPFPAVWRYLARLSGVTLG